MTKADYTHLTLVVDRSGSMSNIAVESSQGINNLIKEQAAAPGEITVSLYDFDTNYRRVFGPVAASEAPGYEMHPGGLTALLDACGRAINETGTWLRSLKESERPSKVLFCIVTDGGENASREFNLPQVKELITQQTDQWSWDFLFLGANIDAFGEAGNLGIRGATQYAASPASVKNLYGAVNSTVYYTRSKGGTMDSYMPDNVDENTVVPTVSPNTSSSDSTS
jgi:hypothetical protein